MSDRTDEELFEEAFSEATDVTTEAVDTSNEADEFQAEDSLKAEPEKAEEASKEEPTQEETQVVAKDTLEEKQEVDWEQKFKSFEGRIKKREEQWESEREASARERAALQAELEALKKTQDTANNRPEQAETEQADLSSFEEEYGPDVIKAMRQVAQETASKVLDENVNPLKEEITGKLDPLLSASQRAERDRYFDTIKGSHEDLDIYLPDGEKNQDLLDYINEQPSYIARSMMEVYNSGTAEEAIDLLDRYKEARNITRPAVADPNHNQEQSDRRRKQAQAAAAVRSRRSAPPKGRASKDDFDAAWEEAVGQD